MKLGDVVTVTGHRAKNNPHVGNASTVVLADGKKLFAGSSSRTRRRRRRRNSSFLDDSRTRQTPMTHSLKKALVASVAVLLAQPALAQWPTYEAKSVPRKRDGTVNLEAPAPRAEDGHPDFSGLWERVGPGGADPDFDALQSPDGGPPAATFWNIGAGVRGGLPFTPARGAAARRAHGGQPEEQSRRAVPADGIDAAAPASAAAQDRADPGPHRDHVRGQRRACDRSSRTAALFPTLDEDLQPWWYGYSAGRWEGDTLVVETVGFRDDVWLDVQGSPLTSTGKMTERFTRPNFGKLQIDVTIEDPAAYTATLHGSRESADPAPTQSSSSSSATRTRSPSGITTPELSAASRLA